MKSSNSLLRKVGALESLYTKRNRRSLVSPDPLEFLYDYPTVEDREIVGLLAASLAFGHVKQILRSIQAILELMKGAPSIYLDETSETDIARQCASFRHRWVDGQQMAAFLIGVKQVRKTYGNLEQCVLAGCGNQQNIESGLALLARHLSRVEGGQRNRLVADPTGPSASKRWHLFMRWMVRQDAVDPGGWQEFKPDALRVPLDTHMHQIALAMRLTRRPLADRRAAWEVTKAFARFAPDDPVRYDFALTRFGIHQLDGRDEFLRVFHGRA